MNAAGYTLLETLIALAILSIALTGMVPAFQAALDANSFSEERSNAVAAAQEVMEALRQTDPADMPTGGASAPVVVQVGAHEYEVVARYCAQSGYCNAATRHVVVEVDFAGKTVYALETVYTRLR
jgi:prepilin-type N-terminal cleavage/methylation domain-containing protein